MKSIVEILQELEVRSARILQAGADEDHPGAWGVAAHIGDMMLIVSVGAGWDHCSVSLPYRVPSYEEMKWIKRLCFRDDEWAMELHAPPSKHINRHPYVLHLWRPHDVPIPTPPEIMV